MKDDCPFPHFLISPLSHVIVAKSRKIRYNKGEAATPQRNTRFVFGDNPAESSAIDGVAGSQLTLTTLLLFLSSLCSELGEEMEKSHRVKHDAQDME